MTTGGTHYHIRTFSRSLYNQRVGCLQWLVSRAFRPAKRSSPYDLINRPWGMICIGYNVVLRKMNKRQMPPKPPFKFPPYFPSSPKKSY